MPPKADARPPFSFSLLYSLERPPSRARARGSFPSSLRRFVASPLRLRPHSGRVRPRGAVPVVREAMLNGRTGFGYTSRMQRGRSAAVRRTKAVVVSFALGIITTFAVAWVGAARENTLSRPKVLEDIVHSGHFASVRFSRGRTVDHCIVDWSERVPDSPSRSSAGSIALLGSPSEHKASRTPRWSKAWLSEAPDRPTDTWLASGRASSLHELAAGWPFRALRCEFDSPVPVPKRTPPAVYTPRRGIALDCHTVVRGGGTVFQPRALPYGVLVPGFAANTALYAACWFVAVFGTRDARRRLRACRGKCERCGYDLHGQVSPGCPECGHRRPT
jgi:hypothetical protein